MDFRGTPAREILRRSASAVQAENTALWLADAEHLVPVLGTGTHADQFIGDFRQPLSEGLISFVFASGQSLCDNAIDENPRHSPLLDQQLGINTRAMIVQPLTVLGETVGVITCVRTTAGKTFDTGDMAEFEFAAACVGRFFAAALITSLSSTAPAS